MRARLTKLLAGLTAVAALAVGGATLAGAASTPSPPPTGRLRACDHGATRRPDRPGPGGCFGERARGAGKRKGRGDRAG
jgi:hypothetical protein